MMPKACSKGISRGGTHDLQIPQTWELDRFVKGYIKKSMKNLINKKFLKLASLLLGLGLTVVIIILLSLNSTAVYNELVALDLLPKPEKLTELYFEDSAHLPASATGSGAISFTFVIHNLETTDYRYVYDIVIIANGRRHVVDGGNALVKNNRSYVKKEEFSLLNSPGRQDVVVELVNLRQSIDFWVTYR